MLQRVVAFCMALQACCRELVCCSVLQCVLQCMLQGASSVLQRVTGFLQMCCHFLQCVAVCVSACVAVPVAVLFQQKEVSSKRTNTTALHHRGKNEFAMIWSALEKLMFVHRANVLNFFGRTRK